MQCQISCYHLHAISPYLHLLYLFTMYVCLFDLFLSLSLCISLTIEHSHLEPPTSTIILTIIYKEVWDILHHFCILTPTSTERHEYSSLASLSLVFAP